MRLSHIAYSNLKRRRAKTLFSVVSLAMGVAVFVALQAISGTLQADLAHQLDQYGANLVIVPKSDSLSLTYGGITVGQVGFGQHQLAMDVLDSIGRIHDADSISIVSPKVVGAAPTDSGEVLVVGIDFAQEFALKKWWSLTAGRRPADSTEVILGSEAANKLAKAPGDQLQLGSNMLSVAGILAETGSQDDQAIFLELSTAQNLLNMPGQLSLVEIAALCTTCPIDEIAAQLSQVIPVARVTPLKEAVATREAMTGRLATFATAISVLVIIISSLVVLTTVMSSVNDRTREIGILRAIGFRQSHVAQIILLEAVVVGLLGGVFGTILGYAGYQAGINALAADAATRFSVGLISWPVVVAIGLSVSASIPGVIKATRLEPVEALRVL